MFAKQIARATRTSAGTACSRQTARFFSSFTLNTGASIPAIGFGTFQDADAQEDAVSRALRKGLRLIDTARVYDVEKQVGKGVKKSG
jgi:alcohol dehydrogenase (NADP+)